MSNKQEALAICSEFADEYGFDIEDQEKLVVYTESKYLNELKNMLDKKNYRLYSYQVYGTDVLINFIPDNKDIF